MKKRTLESIARFATTKGFGRGLLLGLAAGGLILPNEAPRPHRPAKGIADDWKAVGRDMNSAMGHGRKS